MKSINVTNKTDIKIWNLAPFKMLIKNGYKYNIPKNENNTFTNIRNKTIVDTIWTKSIQSNDTEIINLIGQTFNNDNCSISDHNPVVATFDY